MSMTADGKIATVNRAIQSFGSRRDLRHLYELRATADAVLCGAGTVNVPGVTLGTGGPDFVQRRRRRGLAEAPLRVVASGQARLRPDAGIFRHRCSPVVVLVSAAASPRRVNALRKVADAVEVFGTTDLDLSAALQWLRQSWGVRNLVGEGGATLNDALFRAGLVDEVHVTVCPWVFGGRSAPTLADGVGLPRLAEATRLTLRSARRAGDELYLVYRVVPCPSSS